MSRTFRDFELAEQRETAKRRRAQRRAAAYDTGARTMLDPNHVEFEGDTDYARSYRRALDTLAGRN